MRVLHWFRKGLRLHDNPSLLATLTPPCKTTQDSIEPYFLYVFDTTGREYGLRGYYQARFLLECLINLDNSLSALHRNFRLIVLVGDPLEVVLKFCKSLSITCVTFESDTEPYSRQRDTEVTRMLRADGVNVVSHAGHTLWDPEWLRAQYRPGAGLSRQLGVPLTYQGFCSLVDKASPQGPPKPLPSIREYAESLSPPPDLETLDLKDLEVFIGPPACLDQLNVNIDARPTAGEHISDIVAENVGMLFPGGESEALVRLKKTVDERPSWVRGFSKPQTCPNGLPISTTGLSAYLRLGCLSARTFWWSIDEAVRSTKSPSVPSRPPVSLHGQLLWREFFYLVSSVTPNYDQISGNPICRQIPWDDTADHLTAWSEARTGFPFIDASLVQLHRHGWMHHLARHSVACFLTRGQLWQSWTAGAELFERLLLDADWALNQSNWMWLSASAFFHQYFRVYCPVGFGKKTDPDGKFIRHFLPTLKRMPKEYIYAPWTAPLSVQKAAGCIVGVDYPRPIVNHQEARSRNLSRMKAAYALQVTPQIQHIPSHPEPEGEPAAKKKKKGPH